MLRMSFMNSSLKMLICGLSSPAWSNKLMMPSEATAASTRFLTVFSKSFLCCPVTCTSNLASLALTACNRTIYSSNLHELINEAEIGISFSNLIRSSDMKKVINVFFHRK
jgi:hypothetical protein